MRKHKYRPELTPDDAPDVRHLEFTKYPVLIAPFYSKPVPVVVRRLEHIDALRIGISVIPDTHTNIAAKKNIDYRQMLEYVRKHNDILRTVMIRPTYAEVVQAFGVYDNSAQIKTELAKLKKEIVGIPPGPAKTELEKEIAAMEVQIESIFPNDFCAAVTSFALQLEGTDIEKLSEDILRDAAIMAERGHDNPADHIGGNFERWPGDKLLTEDINRRAIYLLEQERHWKDRQKHGR